MSFYKIDRKKDGKQGYRVFVSFTNPDGKRITKTKCVYGLQEVSTKRQRNPHFMRVPRFCVTKV